MSNFLTKIHVNKIFHLENFDIELDNEHLRHLIITGKNGSGKTVLVNAIVEFLDKIKSDKTLSFLQYRQHLDFSHKHLANLKSQQAAISEIRQFESNVQSWKNNIDNLYGKVDVSFNNIDQILQSYQQGNFIFAFYEAERKSVITEPKNPIKPVYSNANTIKQDRRVNQFLNFLVDLKVQEALARNEGKIADADVIRNWFVGFESLLKEIFQNATIHLEFNYKDYSFLIVDSGKKFKFTELSDGYSAIIDIVADLILKMQETNTPNREYLKAGLVIIDEIETHLHLELQRLILPMLTRIFPNVQFIVTTHSPFILNSLPNAIAYDLEKRERLEDLTEYSYEALAEGYFGVKSESSYVQQQFDRLKQLAKQEVLSAGESAELKSLVKDFDKVVSVVSPQIKGEYLTLKLEAQNLKAL
jgi:predicted ATP-binding protein involved in virulence